MFTKEQEIEALNESIKHWKRMIAFAKTQKKEGLVSASKMINSIGETWNADNCPLCKLHLYKCSECILCILYGDCDNYETSLTGTTENIWSEVEGASKWSDWIRNANGMVKQLTKAITFLSRS